MAKDAAEFSGERHLPGFDGARLIMLEHILRPSLAEVLRNADAKRRAFFGQKVELCAIINIKSGHCGMDCAFCVQNRHTRYSGYDLLGEQELSKRILKLASLPLKHIGLVAAGAALDGKDFQRLWRTLATLPKEIMPRICVSLGRIGRDQMLELQGLGICRYHHNLETSRNFYPRICSTQKWEQRWATVAAALDLGLEVCCGGIFGTGESWGDRISLAEELARLGISDVPINFLYPQPGTPMEAYEPLEEGEALRIIALFRELLPQATLRVCGGRTRIFSQLPDAIFAAGANALMTGDYLTTAGAGLSEDLAMIDRNGLELDANAPCK